MTRHRPTLTLASVALLALLLSAVVPPTAATPPPASEWSPAEVPGAITALALARDGTGLVVGTADPDAGGFTDADLHFYDIVDGFVSTPPDDSLLVEGTAVVAASPDGAAYARGAASTDGVNLEVYLGNSATSKAWEKELPRPVTGIALANGGDLVAVVTAAPDSGSGNLYLYDDAGTLLSSDSVDGVFHDVTASADGTWVVAVGRITTDDGPRGLLRIYRPDQGGDARYEATVGPDVSGTVLTVAMDPAGDHVVAGTISGRVLSWVNDGVDTVAPASLDLGGSRVEALRMSADGSAVVAGDSRGVHYLIRSGSTAILQRLWQHATPEPVADVDVNATGGIAVAAVPGSQGYVAAFHPDRPEPIWRLGGGANHTVVDADGSRVAVSRGTALEAYTLHRDVTVGFPQENGNLTDTVANRTADSYETLTYDVAFRNTGSLPDTYRVEFSATGDWQTDSNVSRLHLLPNETGYVEVTVTPGTVSPGNHTVSFVARSTADGTVSDHVSAIVRIRPTEGVLASLLSGSEQRVVMQGDRDRVLLHVTNTGNQRADLSVDVHQQPTDGGNWDVDASSADGSLGAGATTTLSIPLQVPQGARDGTQNTLTFTVHAGGATDAVTVRYVVNPVLGVALTTDATAKLVNTTRPGTFNLTVTNQGSVPTDYVFVFERQEFGTTGWTVDIPTDPIHLDEGDSTRVLVTLHPPHNGAPPDRIVVTLTVQPDDGSPERFHPVHENVTISATFHDFPDDEDERFDELPAPGALVVLALLAFVAAVQRRRRR